MSPSLSTSDVGIKIPYHSLHGEVEFKNVNFSYPTRKDHVSCNTDSLLLFFVDVMSFLKNSLSQKYPIQARSHRKGIITTQAGIHCCGFLCMF